MTNTSTKNRIYKKRFYPYPVAVLWHALTDAEAIGEWLMPIYDFELVVGKKFQFRTKPSIGFDGIVHCEVLSVRPHKLLQYSWLGGSMKQATVVTWKLKEVNNGTQLELEHSGFVGASGWFIKQILDFGWGRKILKTLGSYLENFNNKIT